MSDVDSVTVPWRAVMQLGSDEETLSLDLPAWFDRWDARDAFHVECMNVYGIRGVILDLRVV